MRSYILESYFTQKNNNSFFLLYLAPGNRNVAVKCIAGNVVRNFAVRRLAPDVLRALPRH